jgi:hypothetical protein
MIRCSSSDARHFRNEIHKCRKSVAYFLDRFAQIYDATAKGWLPFHLWPAQVDALSTIATHRLTIVLKARQLGLSWLVLGYALWLMLFQPGATVLLFSRRDEEAVDLLKVRLRGLYERLPQWLHVRSFVTDNDHEWHWSNGSRVLAFPTTGGDSYAATLVIIDEADLVPDLDRMLARVKPTIDGGGKMILVSRADKSRPNSPFKKIYLAAKQGHTEWQQVFLGWDARPDRDQNWYESQKADTLSRTGSLDSLHEQYPVTDVEALTARTLDKRFAPQWLEQCWREQTPLVQLPAAAPSIAALAVYLLPEAGKSYVIGADPAQGNPASDDSALTVLCRETGEEVAALAGKLEPATFAQHIDAIGRWFNHADVMVERNNHGWAVLQWLREKSRLFRLCGHDFQEGWLSSSKGKALLYDAAADALRNRETVVHTFATFIQLADVEGNSLRAPEGEYDDRSDSYALACVAVKTRKPSNTIARDLIGWPMPSRSHLNDDGRPKTRFEAILAEIPNLREWCMGDDEPPPWWAR